MTKAPFRISAVNSVTYRVADSNGLYLPHFMPSNSNFCCSDADIREVTDNIYRVSRSSPAVWMADICESITDAITNGSRKTSDLPEWLVKILDMNDSGFLFLDEVEFDDTICRMRAIAGQFPEAKRGFEFLSFNWDPVVLTDINLRIYVTGWIDTPQNGEKDLRHKIDHCRRMAEALCAAVTQELLPSPASFSRFLALVQQIGDETDRMKTAVIMINHADLLNLPREMVTALLKGFAMSDPMAANAFIQETLYNFIANPAVLEIIDKAAHKYKYRGTWYDGDDVRQEVCQSFLQQGKGSILKTATIKTLNETDRLKYLNGTTRNRFFDLYKKRKKPQEAPKAADLDPDQQDAANDRRALEQHHTENTKRDAKQKAIQLLEALAANRGDLKPGEREFYDKLLEQDPSGDYLLHVISRLVPQKELIVLLGWNQSHVSRACEALRTRADLLRKALKA